MHASCLSTWDATVEWNFTVVAQIWRPATSAEVWRNNTSSNVLYLHLLPYQLVVNRNGLTKESLYALIANSISLC